MLMKLFCFLFISFFTNALLAQTPSIESYYDVHAGSKNLTQVRVFLVGETHTVKMDEKMFAHLAETFNSQSSSEDYILLEGWGSDTLNTSIFNLTALGGEKDRCPFRVVGWDNERLFRLTKASFKVSLDAYDALNSPDPKLSTKAAALIRGLFQRYWRSTMFTDRNDEMMRTLEDVSSHAAGKIFVLAGSNHFTKDKRIAAFLKSKKVAFSVLIPKPNSSLRIESMSAFDYVKELATNR